MQFSPVWSPGHHHQQKAENPEHVCMLSAKKTQMG